MKITTLLIFLYNVRMVVLNFYFIQILCFDMTHLYIVFKIENDF